MERLTNKYLRKNQAFDRERTWRNRRNQGIGGLLRSVHDLNANVYDATENFITTRNKLKASRAKLKTIQDEVNQLQQDHENKKIILQSAANELRKAITDLQTPNLYNLNQAEIKVLKIDLWMAEEDVVEVCNYIHDAEDDSNIKILNNVIDNEDDILAEDGIRNINSVSIPNVMANGVIPVNGGGIKINRNKCCVCLEAKIDCVLYKCGHVCMCYACSRLLVTSNENKKCPVCRHVIKDVIRTYFV